jgi:hypothetical protein
VWSAPQEALLQVDHDEGGLGIDRAHGHARAPAQRDEMAKANKLFEVSISESYRIRNY